MSARRIDAELLEKILAVTAAVLRHDVPVPGVDRGDIQEAHLDAMDVLLGVDVEAN